MMRLFSLSFLVLLGLSACGGGNHDDIKEWMRSSEQNLRGKIPPLPQVNPYVPIAYDAAGMTDPFNEIKLEKGRELGGGGMRPDFNRPKEPLEAYPLDSLQYVGFLHRGKVPYAMVLANGALFQVKVGNYLGQDFGIVTSISETEIKLRELVQDTSGDWSERASSLQLQDKEAGK